MIESFELFEKRNLSEDGHWDAVLGQGEPHGLQGHDGPCQTIPSLEDGSVSTCNQKKMSLINLWIALLNNSNSNLV